MEAVIAGRREAVAASAAPAKAGQRTARPTMPAEDLHDPAADHHPRAGNRRTLRARDGSGRAERQQGGHGGGAALRHRQFAVAAGTCARTPAGARSEEHTSELQSLMRTSYAVFCLKNKKRL